MTESEEDCSVGIRQVTVLGAGTMGKGIAYLSALAGYDTVLHDVDEALANEAIGWVDATLARGVEKGKVTAADRQAAVGRIRVTADLEEAARQADVVIEAIPEDPALKRETFAQVDLFCGPDTLLASNTSSISITHLAGAVERRDRFVGLHFFNPPHLMRLLEIVAGERTSDRTIAQARAIAVRMKKDAIVVRDSPGFATSRLGVALGLEAIRMLEDGVASAADIDRAMELGYNHPMGPLRLTDLVGLDVRLSIAEYLAESLGPRFEPPELLRRMVAEGKLGKKSGQGFYEWETE